MAGVANLVQETSSGTGTGDFTVASVQGRQTFNDAFGTGGTDAFAYFISSRTASEYEVGTGHLSDATTLVRDTVIASSNSDAAVSFTAGTKDITCDVPAGLQVQTTATQTLTNKTLTTPTLTLRQGTTPTAEGDVRWDNTNDRLKIGDGSGTKTFLDETKVFRSVATRTALKAAAQSGVVYLSEAGREGCIAWRTGDYSAQVAADTQEGRFFAGDGTATTIGAWVRVYSGPVLVTWYGADNTGATDSDDAWAATIGDDDVPHIAIPDGEYLLTSTTDRAAGCIIDHFGSPEIRFTGSDSDSTVRIRAAQASTTYQLSSSGGSSGVYSPDDAYKGRQLETTASAAALSRGDYIMVRSNAYFDDSDNVYNAEIRQVVEKPFSTTLRLESPLRGTYDGSGGGSTTYIAKLDLIGPVVIRGAATYRGAADLVTKDPMGGDIFDDGRATSDYRRHTAFTIRGSTRVLIKELEFSNFHGLGIDVTDCLQTNINFCQFKHAIGNVSYGVSVNNACENTIIFGCEFANVRHAVSQGSNTVGLGDNAFTAPNGVTGTVRVIGCTVAGGAAYADAINTHGACREFHVHQCKIEGSALYGILIRCAGGSVTDTEIIGATVAGVRMQHDVQVANVGEFHLSNVKVEQGRGGGHDITLTSVTGFFQEGEYVTFSGSGATGYVVSYLPYSSGQRLVVYVNSGTPADTNVITGATSGATGTISGAPVAPGEFTGYFLTEGNSAQYIKNFSITGGSIIVNETTDLPVKLNKVYYGSISGLNTRAPASGASAVTCTNTTYVTLFGNVMISLGGGSGNNMVTGEGTGCVVDASNIGAGYAALT